MTDQPPVNWDGLRPAPSGPRTYAGPEVGAKSAWTCASCGEENFGEIGACGSCGKGGGAKHVGVDPIAKPRKKGPIAVERNFAAPDAMTISYHRDDACAAAFSIWALTRQLTPGDVLRYHPVFAAGWAAREAEGATVPTTGVTDHPQNVPTVQPIDTDTDTDTNAEPATDVSEPPPLFGTPRERTLIAALEYFRDQIVAQQPEEITTGEWLSAVELDELITSLKEQMT